MQKFTINIPDCIQASQFDVAMFLAGKWYSEGKLSSGQAAEMAGISKRTFIELLGKYGYSVFYDDVDELKKDIKNA